MNCRASTMSGVTTICHEMEDETEQKVKNDAVESCKSECDSSTNEETPFLPEACKNDDNVSTSSTSDNKENEVNQIPPARDPGQTEAGSSSKSCDQEMAGINALKQWSVYVSSLLLSFMQQGSPGASNAAAGNSNDVPCDPRQFAAIMSALSNGRCNSNTIQAMVAPMFKGQQGHNNVPDASCYQNGIGNSPPYCPCCHYHNQVNLRPNFFQNQNQYQNFVPNRGKYVQGKDPSVDFTQDIVEESEDERCYDEMSDSVPAIELPPCELGRLEEISELVSSCLPSPIRREKLAQAVENEGYIKKLLNLFHMCEDLENMEGLHHLYEIFKNVFLLNKNALFELMFAEDTIFDVVGCLEFDPGLPTPKRHRQYLRSIATFHQVIPISNPELMSKIHQTYRVQYIQDVVLPTPSVFEENMLTTLSSFIFFNKVDIVSQIQEDEKFLNELFTQLTDEKTEEDRRKELVLFLKEFCTFSQTLQPTARESFFKTLNNLGVLQALEITLAAENRQTKSASVDILMFIVDFSPSMVREYMLQQLSNTEDDSMLMNVIIEQMTCDSDPEMGSAVQLTGIIRTLLDPENMLASANKSEKTDFLNYFYKHCMHVFISPLLANTVNEKPETNDPCTVQLLSLILELLSFCVEHHTYHIKNYILHKDLLRRILVLMKSQHTFLVLGALRFMRKIINLKDEFYNRYITKGNLFAPVIDAFVMNNGRYNLLDSAILEMFEHIRLEDIKSLCTHVIEHFGPTLDKITYVQTFKNLRQRYDQNQDRQKDRQQAQLDNVGSILRPGRFRRDPRQLEEEEEMWFNDDEYEDENSHANSAGNLTAQQAGHPPLTSTPPSSSTSPISGSPQQSGLLEGSPGQGGSPILSGTSPNVSSASSPLEAAAAVAANAGASVGFSAVISDTVTQSGGDPSLTSVSETEANRANLTEKPGATGKTRALVDYEGDSDEEEEEEEDEDYEDESSAEMLSRVSSLRNQVVLTPNATQNSESANESPVVSSTVETEPAKGPAENLSQSDHEPQKPTNGDHHGEAVNGKILKDGGESVKRITEEDEELPAAKRLKLENEIPEVTCQEEPSPES